MDRTALLYALAVGKEGPGELIRLVKSESHDSIAVAGSVGMRGDQ